LTIGARVSCPANANCVGGWEEGTIDAKTARVIEKIFWPGPEFVFARR
jgi:hypothetical protein